MNTQFFLPEGRNQLTTLDPSLDPKCHVGKIISCLPTHYDYSKNEMEVFIGNSFYGTIPLSELSIYDLGEINYKALSPFFMKGHLLTAEITDYSNDTNVFQLSRKKTMEDALLYFSSLEGTSKTIFARKTGISESSVFVDIGSGIQALIPYKEISTSYVDTSTSFEGIDYIPVHILCQNVYGKFIVSYKSTIPYQNFKVGDVVEGRVGCMLEDSSGIFIELNPNQSGILNADFGLHVAQCNGVDGNWFIISNENNKLPARSIKQNEKYFFSIKALKNGDPSHFKLALL